MNERAESSKLRVLVVDDNVDGADSFSVLLQALDCLTSVAYNGPQALSNASTFDPHLAFVDLEMPGMDGKKFVEYARQKGVSARRIVVMSSHSADELHQRFRIGEAIAVINKTEPKQQEAFLMIIDSIMRR